MKKLLTLVAFAMFFCSMSANSIVIDDFDDYTLPPVGKVIVEDSQWWPNFTNGNTSTTGEGKYAKNYKVAIFIPGTYAGKKIAEIKCHIADTRVVSSVEAWIAEELPATIDLTTTKFSKSVIAKSVNQVTLLEPYVITSKGVYVGYSFNVKSFYSYETAKQPIALSDTKDTKAGCHYRSSNDDKWVNLIDLGYNSPGITVLLTGDGEEDGGNTGGDNTDNSDNIDIDNGTDTDNGGNGNDGGTGGDDGVDMDNDREPFPLVRRVVVEKFTGSWCPNCTRGMAGFDFLAANFPNSFIGIAAHGGQATEPMSIGYDNGFHNAYGYPGATINRNTRYADPYQNGRIRDAFREELNQPSIAAVRVIPTWDRDHNINITTNVWFTEDVANNGRYTIAYVVVANGVHGSSYSWAQANNLSGAYSGDAYLNKYAAMSNPVYNMRYNHVVICAKSPAKGIHGSLPQNITARRNISHNYTIQKSELRLLSNIDRWADIEVIAMVIDTEGEVIVNADEANVSSVTTGIDFTEVIHHPNDNTIYSINGLKMGHGVEDFNRLPKGIYIIEGKKVMK